MIYGLVVVTGIGATTLLATFTDQTECTLRQAMIPKSTVSQAQCWPSESTDRLQASIKELNTALSGTIRK
jgi:hypothetical protein